mmetsp:Transcript_24830/g.51911  ORF Transcript_24830/g.51911 Transcript_24830/m.51911 type:complete len:229 (-) Transcript_24830:58-744(-)
MTASTTPKKTSPPAISISCAILAKAAWAGRCLHSCTLGELMPTMCPTRSRRGARWRQCWCHSRCRIRTPSSPRTCSPWGPPCPAQTSKTAKRVHAPRQRCAEAWRPSHSAPRPSASRRRSRSSIVLFPSRRSDPPHCRARELILAQFSPAPSPPALHMRIGAAGLQTSWSPPTPMISLPTNRSLQSRAVQASSKDSARRPNPQIRCTVTGSPLFFLECGFAGSLAVPA